MTQEPKAAVFDEPDRQSQSTNRALSRVKKLFRMRETGLVLIILALFIAMSFASPYFLTWVNMRAMAMAFAVEGIVVVGMTILLISGGIDLSVGSVTALAMVIAGLLFLSGVDPWTASALAILACAAIGAIMGFFVTVVGLHHFIVSLCRHGDRTRPVAAGRGRRSGLTRLPPSSSSSGGSIGVLPVVINHLSGWIVAASELHDSGGPRCPEGFYHRQQREAAAIPVISRPTHL